MITVKQLKALPPETEIMITKPKEGDTNELSIYWASPIMDRLAKVVAVDELYIRGGSSIKTGDGFTLAPEWLSLKQPVAGTKKRAAAKLRSKKRTKYKKAHDYNRLRQITQTKYDRIKYRARCEGADTVSNDNRFMYNGFLYQQDYGTGASYKGNRSTCCMRTRVNKVKLKDVLTRSADTTTIVRRKVSDLPMYPSSDFEFTNIIEYGNPTEDEVLPASKLKAGVVYNAEGEVLKTTKDFMEYFNITQDEDTLTAKDLIASLFEDVTSVGVTKGTTLEEDRKINKDWTASHYDNNYTLTEDDIEKGFVRVDAYFVNRMWKINSWDDTGAAFHSLKTYTRIGNNKNTLKRELIALAKQTKALCKLHGVTDEELL